MIPAPAGSIFFKLAAGFDPFGCLIRGIHSGGFIADEPGAARRALFAKVSHGLANLTGLIIAPGE
jgi:hypothetical protein